MLRSLNAGVSGIQQFQGKLDVIGNNISNANTPGYKSARADFEDAFSQTLQMPGAGSGVQIGTGVDTGAVRSLFTAGTLSKTYRQADFGIDGDGFFMVRDTVTDEQFATRAGDFELNSEGYLITSSGLRVQGYTSPGGALGDLRIDKTGMPAELDPDAGITRFTVANNGIITVHLDDGTEFQRGQFTLQRFMNPGGLIKEGHNLYSVTDAAGGLAAPAPPGTDGTGDVAQYYLEMSNVDLAAQFASLITTQRGFQASARIITTSDEMLQEVVNLKR